LGGRGVEKWKGEKGGRRMERGWRGKRLRRGG